MSANMSMPKVAKYMSGDPHATRADATLRESLDLLHSLGVRHLPVVDDLEKRVVVGLVSERDLLRALAQRVPEDTLIEKLMIRKPYCVRPAQNLAESVMGMAVEKHGCVLITDDQLRLKGIFTMVDAARVLAKVLKEMSAGPTAVEDLIKMMKDPMGIPRWRT